MYRFVVEGGQDAAGRIMRVTYSPPDRVMWDGFIFNPETGNAHKTGIDYRALSEVDIDPRDVLDRCLPFLGQWAKELSQICEGEEQEGGIMAHVQSPLQSINAVAQFLGIAIV